jgi:pimeloyl-ACP methyl ester carboxylesterase
LIAGLIATGTACTPDVPQDELEERTSVVFDSESGAIPLPSTAALDDEGTLPDLDTINDDTAEGDLARWLTTLHGWLPASGIEIPVDGPVDESTLTPDAFRVYEFPEDGDPIRLTVESVSFTPMEETEEGAPALITASVEGGFKLDTRYGYVMTDAVLDTDGQPLLAPQALFLATAETPLLQEDGTPNFSALESLPEDQRQDLASLQQLYSPTVAAASSGDDAVERIDMVAVGQWYTARDTFLLFDITTGQTPFPISSLIGEDGTVDIPTDGLAEPSLSLVEELNTRTGFSTTASAWMPVAGPIDPASITEDNFKVAQLITPYAPEEYEVIYQPDMNVIEVQPKVPLEFDATQVVLTDQSLTDPDGMPVKADLIFVLLRTEYDVADENGNSLVSLVSDEQAQALQAAKEGGIEDLVGLAAPVLGFQRTNLASGTGFDTTDPTLTLRDLRARAVFETTDAGNTEATIDGTAETDPTTNIGTRIQAEFSTQSFVDGGELQADPTTTAVPITVTLPKEANCTAPYDIAIVQHGLGSNRGNASAAFADAMAGADYCLATVSMDFPLHGERATGDTSGEGFISADLVATKNYMHQSVVDLHVLTEVLLADGLEGLVEDGDTTDNDYFNNTEFGYVGTSLGGILGTNFVATAPEVRNAVYTVAGAKFTDILLGGDIGGPLVSLLPGEEGSFERFQVVQFIQWLADPVEPWNFAAHTTSAMLPTREYDGTDYSDGDAVDAASVLVQMAEGDATVPNSSTQRLADALGVTLDDTTFTGVNHGFLNGDSAEADCARAQAAQWITSGLAGNAELTSDLENACQ